MTEAIEQSVTDTRFLDDSDDFIQSHIDSHLSPSRELIEEREDIDKQELVKIHIGSQISTCRESG